MLIIITTNNDHKVLRRLYEFNNMKNKNITSSNTPSFFVRALFVSCILLTAMKFHSKDCGEYNNIDGNINQYIE